MVITQKTISPTLPPLPTTTTQDNSIKQSKKKESSSTNNEVSATMCSNCRTTTTPLWRRAPNGDTICNACGLYLKARNTLRPPSLKKQQQLEQQPCVSVAGTCPGGGQCNGTGGSASCEGCPAFNQHQVNRHALICANCRTTTTPLWRRDESGNTICNACGLYYKLHDVHRPVSMKRSVIKRRKRMIVSDDGQDQDELESTSSEQDNDSDDEEKVKKTEEKKMKKRRVVNPYQRATAATSRVHVAVPAIEDYIIPKRTTLQQQEVISTPSSQRLPPPPTTPPLNPIFRPRTLPSIAKRFDPLFDYRTTSNIELAPIMTNPYQDLTEFDSAMTRLERLRRRVAPEQSKVLSLLTSSLEEIVEQAENILLKS